jgi:pyrimidine-nucleoside phosphorylase
MFFRQLCYNMYKMAKTSETKELSYMLMSELIAKKRDGGELSRDEIRFIIEGYTKGEIPDYQVSAFLMAVYFQGMNARETLDLTMAMVESGEVLDLSSVSGIKADKHSTGGVGDKASLVLCPMVAALGVKMAKMSGRGLGHTGGTIDKLESFPGFTCALSLEHFLESVDRVGFAIAEQTANLDPADKKLYALRDVTGTVAAPSLIVSSIMSKKLAAGADVIVLDVKTGRGSFQKSDEDAFALARAMVDVGRMAGKKAVAVVTDMEEPLGHAVGNALEVREAISALKGEYKGELMELCLTLGSCILTEAGVAAGMDEARKMLERTISDGSALCKLAEFVRAQGGDDRAVYDDSLLPSAPVVMDVPSPSAGYVSSIAAEAVGLLNVRLGGGRVTKESKIDLSVGLVLRKKVGDWVEKGESLATIHASGQKSGEEAARLLADCYGFSKEKPEKKPFIRGIVR